LGGKGKRPLALGGLFGSRANQFALATRDETGSLARARVQVVDDDRIIGRVADHRRIERLGGDQAAELPTPLGPESLLV
jgi:hypothetical protein